MGKTPNSAWLGEVLSFLAQPEIPLPSREKLRDTYVGGFPRWCSGKESACNAEDLVRSLGQEDSLEKEMATSTVFLPGESHGQRSLGGYSP